MGEGVYFRGVPEWAENYCGRVLKPDMTEPA